MISSVRQMLVEPNSGFVVLLRSDGTITRQRPSMGATAGIEWETVNTDDLPARAVQVGTDLGGKLKVMLATGALYEEVPPRTMEFRRVNTWKEIEGPTE